MLDIIRKSKMRCAILTGSYDGMWYIDIALAIAAALIHPRIREAKLLRRMALA
jgi:hypothetical protein